MIIWQTLNSSRGAQRNIYVDCFEFRLAGQANSDQMEGKRVVGTGII